VFDGAVWSTLGVPYYNPITLDLISSTIKVHVGGIIDSVNGQPTGGLASNRATSRFVLRCVAVCCSLLQSVALCCIVLQCVAVCCSVCSLLACVAQHISR